MKSEREEEKEKGKQGAGMQEGVDKREVPPPINSSIQVITLLTF